MDWHSIQYQIGRLLWILVTPGNLVLWLLLVAMVLQFLRPQLAKRLIISVALLMLIIAITPMAQLLISPLEQRFTFPGPQRNLAAIVVLGGSQHPAQAQQSPFSGINDHSERMWAAAALARQYPQAKLVFVGGEKETPYGTLKESDVATTYFQQMGIDASRLIVDNRSKNTADNARYTKELIIKLDIDLQPGDHRQPWMLVTSAVHMPRAMGSFMQQGLAPVPYPVNVQSLPIQQWIITPDFSNNLSHFELALHEWLGLVKYYAAGKTNSLFPGPHHLTGLQRHLGQTPAIQTSL